MPLAGGDGGCGGKGIGVGAQHKMQFIACFACLQGMVGACFAVYGQLLRSTALICERCARHTCISRLRSAFAPKFKRKGVGQRDPTDPLGRCSLHPVHLACNGLTGGRGIKIDFFKHFVGKPGREAAALGIADPENSTGSVLAGQTGHLTSGKAVGDGPKIDTPCQAPGLIAENFCRTAAIFDQGGIAQVAYQAARAPRHAAGRYAICRHLSAQDMHIVYRALAVAGNRACCLLPLQLRSFQYQIFNNAADPNALKQGGGF